MLTLCLHNASGGTLSARPCGKNMSASDKEYISVIVPAFNDEKWVERCVDSVLDALDADSEVIIVDDGSTDSTLEKVRKYEDLDPRVTVIASEHGGVSMARKTGVENSNGDYVIFLDADDVMPAGCISGLRKFIGPDVDIIVTNVSDKYPDGVSTLQLSGMEYTTDGREMARLVLLGDINYSIMGKLFSKRLFRGFYWDTNPIYAGLFQRALVLNLALASDKVIVAPSVQSTLHILRPWSLSAMLQLRPEGIDRLWQSVRSLDLPHNELVIWGLDLLDKTLLQRGVPFSNNFTPAVELRSLAHGMELGPRHRHIIALLKSERKRLLAAREAVRTQPLSMLAAHISFVIVCQDHPERIVRTVNSILNTGFRNIEIVLVDNSTSPDVSIRLNEISILHRHIIVKKHTPDTKRHPMLTGIKSATGYAVCFLKAGDTINQAGMLEALRHVDLGSKLTFMAFDERHRMTRMPMRSYDPTTVTAIHDGAGPAFDNLLGRGSITPAAEAFIARRSVLKPEYFWDLGEDTSGNNVTLMLKILASKPEISASSMIALNRFAYSTYRSGLQRCKDVIHEASHIIDTIDDLKLDNPGRRQRIAEGLLTALTEIIAEAAAMPLSGYRRGKKLLNQVTGLPEYQAFFSRIPDDSPNVAQLLSRIRMYAIHNRGLMLKRILLGC